MRAEICSLVSRSVKETLIVRSKGRNPLWTLTSVASVLRIARLQPITVRRKRLRVTSIFLARAISSSRFKSGISAICERYMRIGSLLHLLTSGGGGRASAALPGISPSCRCSSNDSWGSACWAMSKNSGDRGFVDQVDAFFLQGNEKIVELVGIDFLVGQVFVDFVVGQITLGLALCDQFLHILVEVVHLATPFTP